MFLSIYTECMYCQIRISVKVGNSTFSEETFILVFVVYFSVCSSMFVHIRPLQLRLYFKTKYSVSKWA